MDGAFEREEERVPDENRRRAIIHLQQAASRLSPEADPVRWANLQMRLGNLEEGRAAVAKLLELDPSDKVGARVLLEVLERVGQDDDE